MILCFHADLVFCFKVIVEVSESVIGTLCSCCSIDLDDSFELFMTHLN